MSRQRTIVALRVQASGNAIRTIQERSGKANFGFHRGKDATGRLGPKLRDPLFKDPAKSTVPRRRDLPDQINDRGKLVFLRKCQE